MNYLFGINGRIGRLKWWMGHLVQYVFLIIAFAILFRNMPEINEANILIMLMQNGMSLFVIWAISLWVSVALCVKRYHDRNKSGFWFFLIFVPIIGPIWQLIELGFLSGNAGANNYGSPDGNSFDADSLEAEIAGEYAPSASISASIDRAVAQRSKPQPVAQQGRPSFGGQPAFGKRGL